MRKRPMTQVDLFLAYQEGYARVKWEVISTAEPQAAPYTCMVQAHLSGVLTYGVCRREESQAMPICRVYV